MIYPLPNCGDLQHVIFGPISFIVKDRVSSPHSVVHAIIVIWRIPRIIRKYHAHFLEP
jgi:hypothetical protein